jgi:hypothetical protein
MLIKKKNLMAHCCVNIIWLEVRAHAFCAFTHTKVHGNPLRKISGGSVSWVMVHVVKKEMNE